MDEFCRQLERSIIKDFRKTIWKPFIRGLNEYEMIKPGDQIAVCISGGEGFLPLSQVYSRNPPPRKMEFGLFFW